jgi:hypothetical protein
MVAAVRDCAAGLKLPSLLENSVEAVAERLRNAGPVFVKQNEYGHLFYRIVHLSLISGEFSNYRRKSTCRFLFTFATMTHR